MLQGMTVVAPMGALFLFAILFFAILADAGLFAPMVRGIVRLTRDHPPFVTIGTAVPPPSSEPPPSGGTLTDSVGTDKSIYARSETVAMSALVKRDGIAVAGATVQFAITTPTGTANVNATTGSDGFARATYRIGKAKNAVGTYTLRANASSNGDTASSSASFTVR